MSQLSQGNVRTGAANAPLPHTTQHPQLSSVSVQSTSNAVTNVVASVRQPVSTVLATATSVLSNRNVNSHQPFQLQQPATNPAVQVQQLQQPIIALSQSQAIQVLQPQTIQLQHVPHVAKAILQQGNLVQTDISPNMENLKEDRDHQSIVEVSLGKEKQQKQEGLPNQPAKQVTGPEFMDVETNVETSKQDDALCVVKQELTIPSSQAITPLTLQLSAPILNPAGVLPHTPSTVQVISSQPSTPQTPSHIITPKLTLPLTLTSKVTQSPTSLQQQSIVLPARLALTKFAKLIQRIHFVRIACSESHVIF